MGDDVDALDHLLVEAIEGEVAVLAKRLCLLHIAQRLGADAAQPSGTARPR
jgi:hypothetical protein